MQQTRFGSRASVRPGPRWATAPTGGWGRWARALFLAGSVLGSYVWSASAEDHATAVHRYLYVATPGIRDELQYGGHGILVFDIDNGHRFVRRIPAAGLSPSGKPLNVKGICANAATRRLYESTTRTLTCFDLVTDKILWERSYEGGCDRMALSPSGKVMYLPSLEGPFWNVIEARNGKVITQISPGSGAHNTVFGPDGRLVYLAGLHSRWLTVVDAKTQTALKTVGPFGASIRPFTINGRQTLCFMNVDDLLGFEVGDLNTGMAFARVEVQGFAKGPTKRHGCPSHGIALSPDEKEVWLADGAHSCIHVFRWEGGGDPNSGWSPPQQVTSVSLRDQPGWITFGIDGHYVYPSTGDVIEAATRKIVAELTDEHGAAVQSEKLLEVDFQGGRPLRAGNQFGIGQVH